jgi:hypothetical protein
MLWRTNSSRTRMGRWRNTKFHEIFCNNLSISSIMRFEVDTCSLFFLDILSRRFLSYFSELLSLCILFFKSIHFASQILQICDFCGELI